MNALVPAIVHAKYSKHAKACRITSTIPSSMLGMLGVPSSMLGPQRAVEHARRAVKHARHAVTSPSRCNIIALRHLLPLWDPLGSIKSHFLSRSQSEILL